MKKIIVSVIIAVVIAVVAVVAKGILGGSSEEGEVPETTSED